MKSKLLSLISAICLVAFVAGTATAFVSSGTVSVAANVPSIYTFSVVAKSTGTVDPPLGGINFGDQITPTFYVANQYVEVNYNDNFGGGDNHWEIQIYTDNFSPTHVIPSTTTWGFQAGGMKGSVAGNRVSLAWRCEDTIAAPSGVTFTGNKPDAGDPRASQEGNEYGILTEQMHWTFIKDKADENDPSTSPANESWLTAEADGYANIAFGSGLYSNFIDAYNSGTVDIPNYARPATTPVVLYVQGDFAANADAYSTGLGFDLVHK